MSKSKKNVLVSSLAVLTAAVMLLGGGTYAYLQGETEDVVNTFNTNEVLVELDETTGSEYEIVPGMSSEKDPTVTVNATVPAYVYVEVTDATDGLVTYELADGWTALDGVENVYYREVEASDAEQTFAVLKDNTVSYDAALANSDMLNEDGTLKDGLTLTFKASAVQKEPFNDPSTAWSCLKGEITYTSADSAADIASAVAAADDGTPVVIALTSDVAAESDLNVTAGDVTIDLQGYKLSYSGDVISVGDGSALTVENGDLVFEDLAKNSTCALNVTAGGSLTLNGVDITSNGSCVYPIGEAEVNITNSVLNGTAYCVATNAGSADNYNPVIHIENSELNAWTPVLVNVPCELTMDNCTVNSEMQGVVVRGGTAVLSNCTINNDCGEPDETMLNYFNSRNWGSGNTVNLAGITIGNKVADGSTSYQYPSNVTLNNTKVISSYYPTVYIWGNNTEANGVTLTYDDASDVGTVVYGGGCAVINGVTQTA